MVLSILDKIVLFVVNHLPIPQIEKFLYDDTSNTLKHVQSIASSYFTAYV